MPGVASFPHTHHRRDPSIEPPPTPPPRRGVWFVAIATVGHDSTSLLAHPTPRRSMPSVPPYGGRSAAMSPPCARHHGAVAAATRAGAPMGVVETHRKPPGVGDPRVDALGLVILRPWPTPPYRPPVAGGGPMRAMYACGPTSGRGTGRAMKPADGPHRPRVRHGCRNVAHPP